MTNKRKKKTRQVLRKCGGSYQALTNLRRPLRTPITLLDRCLTADDRSVHSSLIRALDTLTVKNLYWVFRGIPEIVLPLLRRDLSQISGKYFDVISDVVYALNSPCSRNLLLAETLIEQFDACFADPGQWVPNKHLSSRALFDSGAQELYFRFGGMRLEACIGALQRTEDPVFLFRTEVEPMLRHAVGSRETRLVELMEVTPSLSSKLAPYLESTGWLDAIGCPESRCFEGLQGQAFCRAGLDFLAAPSMAQRERLISWRRAAVEERFISYPGVETPVENRAFYNLLRRLPRRHAE